MVLHSCHSLHLLTSLAILCFCAIAAPARAMQSYHPSVRRLSYLSPPGWIGLVLLKQGMHY